MAAAAATGTEAMFADLGHFTLKSMQVMYLSQFNEGWTMA